MLNDKKPKQHPHKAKLIDAKIQVDADKSIQSKEADFFRQNTYRKLNFPSQQQQNKKPNENKHIKTKSIFAKWQFP